MEPWLNPARGGVQSLGCAQGAETLQLRQAAKECVLHLLSAELATPQYWYASGALLSHVSVVIGVWLHASASACRFKPDLDDTCNCYSV